MRVNPIVAKISSVGAGLPAIKKGDAYLFAGKPALQDCTRTPPLVNSRKYLEYLFYPLFHGVIYISLMEFMQLSGELDAAQ